MDTITVAQTIAERVERELGRVRAARPALSSRISRAENILVTHLSCRRQRTIRVRVAGGRARFLVSGSKGAVYVVDPASWSCSCPDHHRHGKGCKHALICWALSRVGGPPAHRLKVADEIPVEAVGALAVAEESGPYEMRDCAGCLDGLAYDAEHGGRWVAHDECSGTGRALAFVYAKAPAGDPNKRLRECEGCRERFVGRDLYEVHEEHESLTWFVGDELCGACAAEAGIR